MMRTCSYLDLLVYVSLIAILAIGVAIAVLQVRDENEQARRVRILWEAHQQTEQLK